MSLLPMNEAEIKNIDSQVEKMMDWAKSSQAEAEQLAMDSARLLACTGDRLDRIKNQGFFKRCWNRFTGKTGEMERANTSDLISMQKMAFRYVNMLQEQQLLMAHSLLALKNNLISLAVKEAETRNMIGALAQKTLERFESLESRVDQLEISTNLQGWLLGLEERDYDEKFPTDYMRLFRVINDFYQIKKDQWNYNDLMFMRKAIRTVGLNPKQKISLNTFIDRLVDEIQSGKVGFDAYGTAITQFVPEGIANYSKYALENVSSPVFVALHGLKTQYMDRLDMVEELQDEMNISSSEALKRLLRRSIKNLNVDMDYEFPLAETAIEILGCLRMAEKLSLPVVVTEKPAKKEIVQEEPKKIEKKMTKIKKIDVNKMMLGSWQKSKNLPRGKVEGVIPGEDTFFVCLKNDKNRTIYSTSEFAKFDRYAEFSAGDMGAVKLFFVNNQLLAMGRNQQDDEYDLSLFEINENNVDEVELVGEYMEEPVDYKQIFHENGKWYVIGDWSDSDCEGRKLILTGTNPKELNIQNFSYKRTYRDFNIAFAYNKFYTIVQNEDDEDIYDIIYSADMKKWSESPYNHDDYPYSGAAGLITFNNNLYMYSENEIFSIKNNKLSKKAFSRYDRANRGNTIINCDYDKYGVAFKVSIGELAVSNDLKTWKKIDLPDNSHSSRSGVFTLMASITNYSTPSSNFTYGFGKLVTWDTENISWREMK